MKFHSEGTNPTILIDAADSCLYQSKRDGRNRISGLDLSNALQSDYSETLNEFLLRTHGFDS